MKCCMNIALCAVLGFALLAGCGQQTDPGASGGLAPQGAPDTAQAAPGEAQLQQTPAPTLPAEPAAGIPPAVPAATPAAPDVTPAADLQPQGGAGELAGEDAFAVALDNAGVPEEDAYNVKIETDGDNGIPIYDIEFETDYGDYDFEVAIADGSIVGADYEVDEEWLGRLGGSPVTLEGAKVAVAAKVPGASAADVQVREEAENGHSRFEGELFSNSMKYEFEIDPATGIIFDWNADYRG